MGTDNLFVITRSIPAVRLPNGRFSRRDTASEMTRLQSFSLLRALAAKDPNLQVGLDAVDHRNSPQSTLACATARLQCQKR